MKKLIIGIVLVNFLAACSSSKVPEPVAAAPESAPAPSMSTPERAPAMSAPAAVTQVDPLNDPGSMLAKRSVYYPFDVSVVQDADKPVVQAHAKYLGENSSRNIRLEGNADERGSNEYNLALGQRRADGVKKMLILGGAKASQIVTASYGEEKPRCTEHEESCWSQNRRTDIKY